MSFAVTISQLKQAVQNGAAIRQRTSILSLNVAGSRATVRRRSEAAVTMGGQTRSGVEESEDTWVRTSEGWRLLLVKAIGSVEAAPASGATPDVVKEIGLHARSVDDLNAIGDAIGDARVVALGEATHGTREFSAIRARVVEYLAEKKGFTVVAVEDNWTEAAAIDDYIKTGPGDAKSALARLKGWPFRTREMLSLIEAMRARNERAAVKMSYAGFDMTWSEAAREEVTRFLRTAAPDQLAAAETWYAEVIALGTRRPGLDADATAAAEAARKVVDLVDNLRASSDASRWRRARQAAEVVYQATAFRIRGQSPGFRDQMMARNVQWLCEQEHPGEKILLWAHNAHISAESNPFFKPMGVWLRERLGNRYYALGLLVAGGEVRAVGSKGLAIHVMPPAAPEAGESRLSEVSNADFFIDMRRLLTGAARAWLDQPHTFYSVGARWNEEVVGANTAVFSPAKSFDGFVFIRRGHASIAP
jgi:erythromycin esterase